MINVKELVEKALSLAVSAKGFSSFSEVFGPIRKQAFGIWSCCFGGGVSGPCFFGSFQSPKRENFFCFLSSCCCSNLKENSFVGIS